MSNDIEKSCRDEGVEDLKPGPWKWQIHNKHKGPSEQVNCAWGQGVLSHMLQHRTRRHREQALVHDYNDESLEDFGKRFPHARKKTLVVLCLMEFGDMFFLKFLLILLRNAIIFENSFETSGNAPLSVRAYYVLGIGEAQRVPHPCFVRRKHRLQEAIHGGKYQALHVRHVQDNVHAHTVRSARGEGDCYNRPKHTEPLHRCLEIISLYMNSVESWQTRAVVDGKARDRGCAVRRTRSTRVV